MKKSIYFVLMLLVSMAMAGCMKENCGCEPKTDPPVLFQYEYYNYAWGFRHFGFMIDGEGRANGFRQPKNWTAPDSMGMISRSDLEYNLYQCDTVYTRIDRSKLNQHYSKVEDIRSGKIIDYGMVMADAGTGELSAWYWNRKAGKYENVFLMSNGDIYRVNSHPDVKEMVEYLKEIGKKTNNFYWYDGK